MTHHLESVENFVSTLIILQQFHDYESRYYPRDSPNLPSNRDREFVVSDVTRNFEISIRRRGKWREREENTTARRRYVPRGRFDSHAEQV